MEKIETSQLSNLFTVANSQINPVDKTTQLSFYTPHQRSTTVSIETYSFIYEGSSRNKDV